MDKLWISIMAGVVLTDISTAVNKVSIKPALRVVRSIPNTPVKVRKGSVGVTFSDGCSSGDKEVVCKLFSSIARCVQIPERLQNSFAALAGSGPAFIYQERIYHIIIIMKIYDCANEGDRSLS